MAEEGVNPANGTEAAGSVSRRYRWIGPFAAAILLGPVMVWLPATGLRSLRPLAPLPSPSGSIVESTDRDWGSLVLDDKRCLLVNNVWNKGAAGPGFQQEVFVENANGSRQPGWRWRSPWRLFPQVVSQPQAVCGDKPWDKPRHLTPEFPFRVGSRRLTADFDVEMRAVGIYNLTFTLWAVRSLPAGPGTVSHEIMIWGATAGQSPAGRHHGTFRTENVAYDVYVEEGHKDASGANSNTWTYVAFVARQPVLRGSLEFSAFTSYLVDQKLLLPENYITSLELGNEVVGGVGIVELREFGIRFE